MHICFIFTNFHPCVMFNENISLLQSDTMEWMQGMQQPLLYQLWPVFQNHYYQFIPSTWKWGQSFQHVGRNGKQHDTTTGWVDGHAGHGNAKHGQFILYLVFFLYIKLVFSGRDGWWDANEQFPVIFNVGRHAGQVHGVNGEQRNDGGVYFQFL